MEEERWQGRDENSASDSGITSIHEQTAASYVLSPTLTPTQPSRSCVDARTQAQAPPNTCVKDRKLYSGILQPAQRPHSCTIIYTYSG